MNLAIQTPSAQDSLAIAKAPAICCYEGTVFHQRHGKLSHRLTYRVFALCLTLDRAKEAEKALPFFSHNRFNLFSLHDHDHMEEGYEDLKIFVQDMLIQGGALTAFDPMPARIDMLAYPRFLGKAFNPLTIFFCYDQAGQPIALLYQVRNTFKERHHYAVRLSDEGLGSQQHWRHSCPKRFHVSPFLALDGHYQFDITLPGKDFSVTIEQSQQGKPQLTASFTARRIPLSGWSLLLLAFRYCQSGWKILGAIHWQALKLWWKGAPFHKKPPKPDEPVTPASAQVSPNAVSKKEGQ